METKEARIRRWSLRKFLGAEKKCRDCHEPFTRAELRDSGCQETGLCAPCLEQVTRLAEQRRMDEAFFRHRRKS